MSSDLVSSSLKLVFIIPSLSYKTIDRFLTDFLQFFIYQNRRSTLGTLPTSIFDYANNEKKSVNYALNTMPQTGIEPVRVSLPTGF